MTLICVTDGDLGFAAGDSMLPLLLDVVEEAAEALYVYHEQGQYII